jgi:hypothetical protein
MHAIALRQPEASPRTIVADALPRFPKLPAVVNRARSLELDMIRGMALFVMMSDHLLGNPWSVFTSRPLGVFSGADVFVLISGVASGLKYQRSYAAGGMSRVWTGLARSWAMLLVTCAFLRMWSNLGGILYLYAILWGLVLVLAPACARGWRNAVLGVSLLGWLAAFVVPLPGPFGRWGFNPLSWQLLFCVGFAFGHSKARGAELVPRRRTLLLLIAPMAVAFFLLRHSAVDTQGWLFYGRPRVGPLRLLDFLGVAYFCYHLVRVPDRLAKLFASLGRHSLWVFIWVCTVVAAWEFWKLPFGSVSLRLVAAAGVLASLWLVAPVVKAVKDRIKRTRRKWERVVPVEPAEATV